MGTETGQLKNGKTSLGLFPVFKCFKCFQNSSTELSGGVFPARDAVNANRKLQNYKCHSLKINVCKMKGNKCCRMMQILDKVFDVLHFCGPCDRLATCSGCTPPLARSQMAIGSSFSVTLMDKWDK